MRASIVLIAVLTLLAGVGLPNAHAQTTPVFGPKQYTRTAGPPQTFTEHFQHCGTQACELVIVNGKTDGSARISSATISLNGVQIVAPNVFNQAAARIVIPVGLTDDDTLAITLASGTGGMLTVTVECATSPVDLSAGAVGDSLFDPATLLTALPIINNGTASAQNVTATAITLTGGSRTAPPIPLDLRAIPADGMAILNATFSGAFAPATAQALTISGTYAVGAAIYCFTLTADFTIPRAAPGSALLHQVSVPSNHVNGGGFPPGPPDMDDEVNGSGWTVPIAPFVAGTPTATPTVVNSISNVTVSAPSLSLGPLAVPSPIVVAANRGIARFESAGQLSCGGGASETCAEPSGATTADGVIFATSNWLAAWSTDSGATFHVVDPHTVFPLTTIDFCCDQIVQYVPQIDRFVWLLQGNALPGYRLAVASPADIATYGGLAWTYWNLTTGLFNHNGFFDYPDLAFSDTYLYVSWNAGPQMCKNNCNPGHQAARIPLDQLQAGGTIVIGYTDPADDQASWGGHLAQNSHDAAYWAGLKDSTHLRIFSMRDSENTYSWHDTEVASSAIGVIYNSTTPDGKNWMNKLNLFPRSGVLGATRSSDALWFAWSAASDGNFPQPHVEMVSVDRNSHALLQQVQIWNANYAFAYPALATNACTGEVGLSLEFGGNANYENHAVGIWGDYAIYGTTRSNLGTQRFGDYVTIRQIPPTFANPGNLFAAFGYGYDKGPIPEVVRPATDVRYIVFGRPASSCQIIP